MNWDSLKLDQKIDFIIKFLDTESTTQDLKDDIMQIIHFNDLADTWWTSESPDGSHDEKEREWNNMTPDQKIKAIEEEIDDWDKIALIEFLADHMSPQQIESFKVIYEGIK